MHYAPGTRHQAPGYDSYMISGHIRFTRFDWHVSVRAVRLRFLFLFGVVYHLRDTSIFRTIFENPSAAGLKMSRFVSYVMTVREGLRG